jgi:plasmid stabilization system protein ParE
VSRLVYRAAARRAIAEIAAYIERESQSRAVADDFIDNLTDYCERIAKLPGMMGRRAGSMPASRNHRRRSGCMRDYLIRYQRGPTPFGMREFAQ